MGEAPLDFFPILMVFTILIWYFIVLFVNGFMALSYCTALEPEIDEFPSLSPRTQNLKSGIPLCWDKSHKMLQVWLAEIVQAFF